MCTNDRDLAVRWLSVSGNRIGYTGEVTVKYRLESDRECLTLNSRLGKRTGLLQFFYKHKSFMSDIDKFNFIQRAKMFDVDEKWFTISRGTTTIQDFHVLQRAYQLELLGHFVRGQWM